MESMSTLLQLPCSLLHVVHHDMTSESMRTGPKCNVAPQTDEHIAKLTVQETMDFSAWVQGTELREGASPLLPSTLLKQQL